LSSTFSTYFGLQQAENSLLHKRRISIEKCYKAQGDVNN